MNIWRFEQKVFEKKFSRIVFAKFKILGTLGIWFPHWEQVEEIYSEIMISSRFKAIDNMLADLQLIKLFYYPAIYLHDDNGISNINKNKKQLIINYQKC